MPYVRGVIPQIRAAVSELAASSPDAPALLPEGTRVQITNGPQSDGDQNWYQVRSADGDGTRLRGWVAGSYLVDADDVDVKNDRVVGIRTFRAKVTSYASVNGVGRNTSTGTRVHWGTVAVPMSIDVP